MSENCVIITFTREKFTLHFRNLSLCKTYPSSNERFLKVQSRNLKKLLFHIFNINDSVVIHFYL